MIVWQRMLLVLCLASAGIALSMPGWPWIVLSSPFAILAAAAIAVHGAYWIWSTLTSWGDVHQRRRAGRQVIAFAMTLVALLTMIVTRAPLRARFALSRDQFERAVTDAKNHKKPVLPAWIGAYYVQDVRTDNGVNWKIVIIGPPGFVGFVRCDDDATKIAYHMLDARWAVEDDEW